jgi:hypothetical protein
VTRRLGLGLALVLAACGGDDPPNTLSMYECTPTTLVADQTTAVSCDFEFEDPDLLATSIHSELFHPDGTMDSVDIVFENPDMLVDGPGFFNANLTPRGAGTARLTLRFDNLDDSQSNTVSQTFTVSP